MKHIGIIGLLFLIASLLLWVMLAGGGRSKAVLRFAKFGVAGIWLLLLSGAIYSISSFSLAGDIKTEIVAEQESPNGLYVATTFRRYGGAVVRNSTAVAARMKGKRFDPARDTIILSADGIRKVGVQWLDSQHLAITTDYGEIWIKVPQWQDIQISYAEK